MEKIFITGNIGQDAQIKDSNSGAFITFSVAVTERWKDSGGNDMERTNWYDCTYWPSSKKFGLADYLKKGIKVLVEGKPRYGTYLDKQQRTQIQVGITVTNIELLTSKQDAEAMQQQRQQAEAPAATPTRQANPARQPAPAFSDEPADDLPF